MNGDDEKRNEVWACPETGGVETIISDPRNSPAEQALVHYLRACGERFHLLASCGTTVPETGYFVPVPGERVSVPQRVPALRLRLVKGRAFDPRQERLAGRIELRRGYLAAPSAKNLVAQNLPLALWTTTLWSSLRAWAVCDINDMDGSTLEDAVGSNDPFFARAGRLSPVDFTFEHELLFIALLWPYWESHRTKFHTRAEHLRELGAVNLSKEELKEDNLRRICRDAGLLTPSPRGRAVESSA